MDPVDFVMKFKFSNDLTYNLVYKSKNFQLKVTAKVEMAEVHCSEYFKCFLGFIKLTTVVG